MLESQAHLAEPKPEGKSQLLGLDIEGFPATNAELGPCLVMPARGCLQGVKQFRQPVHLTLQI